MLPALHRWHMLTNPSQGAATSWRQQHERLASPSVCHVPCTSHPPILHVLHSMFCAYFIPGWVCPPHVGYDCKPQEEALALPCLDRICLC